MMTMPTMVYAMNAFDEETVPVVGDLALNIGVPAVPVSEGTVQQQEVKESILQVEPVGMTEVPERTEVAIPVAQEGSSTEQNIQAAEIQEA